MACPRCGDRCTCACSGDPLPTSDWRREVALQVRAHKARKRRGQEADSPQLEFTDEVAAPENSTIALRAARWRAHQHGDADRTSNPATTSCQVAATEDELDIRSSETQETGVVEDECSSLSAVERAPLAPFPRIAALVPKVIEFPRPARCYELAEPVTDQLRIFEAVDELAQLPPNPLSDIEIAPEEPAYLQLDEQEVPIRTAPLGMRAYAAAVDTALLIAAAGLFVVSAGLFANSLPMSKPMIASGAAVIFLLLTIYCLLSLALRRITPGMQASGLSLITFSGAAPTRARLCCRAVATVLSLAALGMGFAWALIDDDQLCWHDRITHTYPVGK
jgi:uncharacterized RDD family membrane protein YckC